MSQPAIHRDVSPQQRHPRAGAPSRSLPRPRPSPEDRRPLSPALWTRSVWSPGTCVRCDRTGLEVTPIGLLPTIGDSVKIYVCRACAFQIEQAHWATLLGDDSEDGDGADDFTWWCQ